MKVEQFTRKSFPVDAVQVTAENMAEVAGWCDGDIREEDGVNYIRVRVHNPINPRQTQAYINDWVLYAGKGYKVYKDAAFKKSFDIGQTQNVVNVTNVFAGSDQIAPQVSAGLSSMKNPGGTNSV